MYMLDVVGYMLLDVLGAWDKKQASIPQHINNRLLISGQIHFFGSWLTDRVAEKWVSGKKQKKEYTLGDRRRRLC